MNLFDRVRDVLAKSEGMNVYDLCVALGMEDARTLVQKCCSNAKYQGRLTSTIEGGKVVYRLAPDGAMPKPKPRAAETPDDTEGAAMPRIKPKRAALLAEQRNVAAAAETPPDRNALVAALQSAFVAADQAMDTYVRSVANPVIYESLKAARDHAGAAWRAVRDAA